MQRRLSFFIALACMAVAVPAQASMHPNAAVDGLAHFMWHLQMTSQALATGNFPAFWQLFTEQSVCTNFQSMTFIFTPAFFVTVMMLAVVAVMMFVRYLMRKASGGWGNQFRAQAEHNYAH